MMATSSTPSEYTRSRTHSFRFPVGPVGFLLVVFCLLAVGVATGSTQAFDRLVLTWLRQPGDLALSHGPGWLGLLMRDFTAIADVPMRAVIVLLVTGGLAAARYWRLGLFIAGALMGGAAFELLLKSLFHRARPDVVPHLVEVHSLSFPSGHATFSAMLFLSLAGLGARATTNHALRIYLIGCGLALMIAVGISRLWLGVHWPSDVLGGWLSGSTYALLITWAAAKLQDLGWIERPGEPGPPRRSV